MYTQRDASCKNEPAYNATVISHQLTSLRDEFSASSTQLDIACTHNCCHCTLQTIIHQ